LVCWEPAVDTGRCPLTIQPRIRRPLRDLSFDGFPTTGSAALGPRPVRGCLALLAGLVTLASSLLSKPSAS
jgi:hypothetical protein